MLTLFPNELILPAGFLYVPDFITEHEEQRLLDVISNIALHNFTFRGFEAKRKAASFGFDYHFESGQLTSGAPIPLDFIPLIEKVSTYLSLQKEIAELLVLQYPEGAVINWHRDAPPFDIIIGISLLAECTFMLRPYDKAKQSRKSIIRLQVGRRSLYAMQGPARSEWEHSTAPAAALRYSITLRTLKA